MKQVKIKGLDKSKPEKMNVEVVPGISKKRERSLRLKKSKEDTDFHHKHPFPEN